MRYDDIQIAREGISSLPPLDRPAWLHRHDVTLGDRERTIAHRQQVAGTMGMPRGVEAKLAFTRAANVPSLEGAAFHQERP